MSNPDSNPVKQDFEPNFQKVFSAVAAGAAPDVTPIWGGLLTSFAAPQSLINLGPMGGR